MGASPNLTHHSAKSNESSQLLRDDVPINFLLTCSQASLDSLQLARLGEVANLRKELQAIVDRIVDNLATAALAAWFRQHDRELPRKALENPEDVLEWAKEQIRKQGQKGAELLPVPVAFGKAHRSAALRYQQRNVGEGKCRVCPAPLDRNSVRYCSAHLKKSRERQRTKSKNLNKPPHGRAPGTLAALAAGREKQATKARDGREPENG